MYEMGVNKITILNVSSASRTLAVLVYYGVDVILYYTLTYAQCCRYPFYAPAWVERGTDSNLHETIPTMGLFWFIIPNPLLPKALPGLGI